MAPKTGCVINFGIFMYRPESIYINDFIRDRPEIIYLN